MSYSSSVGECELAQARAAAYGLIAHGFQYPDGEMISTLADPRRWQRWPEVLKRADEHGRASLQLLLDVVGTFAERSEDAQQALMQSYDRLFGHAVRGKCPAYEMEYGRNEIIRQASDLADLAGFYRAFGLEIAGDASGRPDHIAAECEFMSALCAKESHARAQSGSENADICLDAERSFLRDHLARWLPAFAHRVKDADPGGLFAAMAGFADDFVSAECSRFDIHAGPPTLELKPPDPVLDTTISCSSAGCGDSRSDQQLVQLGSDITGSGEC